MQVLNIHDAKTQLSKLLEQVQAGEEVIIARAGHKISRLVSYAPTKRKIFPPGFLKNKIWIADDFDAPLDELFDFSRASMWEIAIKEAMGRVKLDVNQFSDSIERQGFEWLEIKDAHLRAVATLPFIGDHRDPFDRLLVAQSITEPLLLLTSDAILTHYGTTVRLV